MSMVYDLPLPPSVNNLFPSGAHGRRYASGQYRAWKRAADQMLLAQGRLKIHCGPCEIRITVKDAGKRDIDNFCKPIVDHLVRHGIIEADHREIVRRIELQWGDVEGARVEITPAAEWVQRRGAGSKAA